MNTIHYYSNALKHLSSLTSVLASLDHEFKEIAPRTELDEAHIDLLVSSAQELITAAEALKTVAYDPTPESS
tara:strand:+ start:1291 stop:1506 length:216 start_codon:yes stop_codon:yes gene_type:complete